MKISWIVQHYCKVIIHKWFVAIAGRKTGVSLWRILTHDLSKFGLSEAFAYARQFNAEEKDPEEFAYAWLHHQNINPHHWEYWMTRSGRGVLPGGVTVLKMPEKYVREMVADWMAAGRAYQGSWDMTDWLQRNFWTITLHPESRTIARNILYKLGYDEKRLPRPE